MMKRRRLPAVRVMKKAGRLDTNAKPAITMLEPRKTAVAQTRRAFLRLAPMASSRRPPTTVPTDPGKVQRAQGKGIAGGVWHDADAAYLTAMMHPRPSADQPYTVPNQPATSVTIPNPMSATSGEISRMARAALGPAGRPNRWGDLSCSVAR